MSEEVLAMLGMIKLGCKAGCAQRDKDKQSGSSNSFDERRECLAQRHTCTFSHAWTVPGRMYKRTTRVNNSEEHMGKHNGDRQSCTANACLWASAG